MADLEAALFAHLSSLPGLTALVGPRIFPDRVPQGSALPAVVYQRIDTVRPHSLTGDGGLADVRMQIDAYAVTKSAALAVIGHCRQALRHWSGTVAGVTVQRSLLEGEAGTFDPTAQVVGQGTPGAFRSRLDVLIGHEEAET